MKLSVPEFELEVDGVVYKAQLGVVESFHLGYEDHGIYTALVEFQGPEWKPGFACDGVHPTAPAAKIIASAVWSVIR